MKKILLIVVLVLLSMLFTAACDSSQEAEVILTEEKEFEEAEYIKLTPEEAKEMIETMDVIVVDVRTEEEFNQGHIEGAVLIPDYDLDKLAAEILPDKEATILLYCRSGNRSKLASHLLIGMGYQNVYDFGGILDWRFGEVQVEPAGQN